MGGISGGLLVGGSNSIAATGVDPRANPTEGKTPSTNVPTTQVGAMPSSNATVPVGNWICHTNGWVTEPNPQDECTIYELLNETTQIYTIAGEKFVLDSIDDWVIEDRASDSGVICSAEFSYTVPPKPRGTSYEVRWEVIGDEDRFPSIDFFPVAQEIEVVGRRNGKR